MKDYVMKGTGNSRYLKSVPNFLSLYPTYEDFVAALVQGNLPIDLNGINASGWSQQGTPLNKANLLSDTTAAQYGYGSSATVNQILSLIKTTFNTFPTASKISMIEHGSITPTNGSRFSITTQGELVFLLTIQSAVEGNIRLGFCTPTKFQGLYGIGNLMTGSVTYSNRTITINTTSGYPTNTPVEYIAFTTK